MHTQRSVYMHCHFHTCHTNFFYLIVKQLIRSKKINPALFNKKIMQSLKLLHLIAIFYEPPTAMIIVHIVEPFAAGIAMFVKSLTESMPDDMHIIVHGERNEIMAAQEVKKNFTNPNTRFIRWRSAKRSIDPIKDFFALSELYKILSRLKRKNMVDAVHLHSSKSGLLGRVVCRMTGIRNVFYTPNAPHFYLPRRN